MSRLSCIALAVCLATAHSQIQAQMAPQGSKTLRGEVEGAVRGDHMFIELYVDGRFVDRATVAPDGAFEVRGVATGSYEVRLTDQHGEALKREWIHIADHTGPLTLRLPKRDAARPAGSISLKRLASPIPKAARKEMERAQRAVERGNPALAEQHLRKAIEIHPEGMEARNNLGVRMMQRRDYEGALEEFRRAAEIDPAAAPLNANMALSLIHLKRHAEALAPARAALRAEPDNPAGRYALGIALAVAKGPSAEAIEHLRAASARFPQARLAIAQVLAARGRNADAAEELRGYLAAKDAPQRAHVESWLAALQRPATNALR